MKTTLETLEHWIAYYEKINGTPPIAKIKTQINLLKNLELKQLNIGSVGNNESEAVVAVCPTCDSDNWLKNKDNRHYCGDCSTEWQTDC